MQILQLGLHVFVKMKNRQVIFQNHSWWVAYQLVSGQQVHYQHFHISSIFLSPFQWSIKLSDIMKLFVGQDEHKHSSMSQRLYVLNELVNAQNVKCTFLRRIEFYLILRAQLIRRFCSILFRFAQLFFIWLNYIIRTYCDF